MSASRLASAVAFSLAALVNTNPAAAAPATSATKAFTADDLVRLDRVSDPRVSPDQGYVAYVLRETDYDANKGVQSIWINDIKSKTSRRISGGIGGGAGSSFSPRWGSDHNLYFLSTRSGSAQVWKLDQHGGEAQPVTRLPLDVGAFLLAPDLKHIIVALDVFPDAGTDFAATKKRTDDAEAHKSRGQLFDKLFIRHWDTWKNGTLSQLFAFALDGNGQVTGDPVWLTHGIDGDIPSKPFGGDDEITVTPDSKSVIFSARIAGKTEPWSTNFDLYRVPLNGSAAPVNLTPENLAWDTGPVVSPDGRKLAYRAMKRPGFEADRFGIMIRDVDGTGPAHEIDADWDRSAETLVWSPDGKTLYTAVEDLGQRRVYSVDAKSGKTHALTGDGFVEAFDLHKDSLIVAADTLAGPSQLYRVPLKGGERTQLTQHNAAKLATLGFGDYEQFSFKGANDETVYGYVVKPVGYVPGKKYPVAFIIHGGPQGSMGNHFHYRWNPQTYAGAGFATVFIDFHGSTGYGQAFTDEISGDWGGKPLEDLKKGWAYALAKYDYLDGDRAAALGASYGGYMINWIAGNWSQPWKALVCHDGVFDNRSMAYSTEELWFDEWENKGTQYEHPENYEQFNPVNHVADWKVPMLIIQGGNDFRIPTEQGIAAFTVLQRRGIPSQFLYFPDENHWVLKPQNSVQWHETVLAWIKKWTDR